MTQASNASERLNRLREQLIELSASQTQLRAALHRYMSGRGVSVAAVSSVLRLGGYGLRDFASGAAVISGGAMLERLCDLLGQEDLGQKIGRLGKAVGDRNLALSNRSAEAINMAMDVRQAHLVRGGLFTVRQFCAGFGEYESMVAGIFSGKSTELINLEDREVRKALARLLTHGLDERLQQLKADEDKRKQDVHARFERTAGLLLVRYGTHVRLAEALDISVTSLYDAISGRQSLVRLEQVNAAAQQLLAEAPPATEATEEAAPVEADQQQLGSYPELAALGGETTEAGVPFVLTEESFRQIEGIPVLALRDSLVSAIRWARLLLNIGAQNSDPVAREVLRGDVGNEVEELELAIRLFTFEYPNRLLELYDNQRAVWKNPPKKKGRS